MANAELLAVYERMASGAPADFASFQQQAEERARAMHARALFVLNAFLRGLAKLRDDLESALGDDTGVFIQELGSHHVSVEVLANAEYVRTKLDNGSKLPQFIQGVQQHLIPAYRRVLSKRAEKPLNLKLSFQRLLVGGDGAIVLGATAEPDCFVGPLREELRAVHSDLNEEADSAFPLQRDKPMDIVHMTLGRLLPSPDGGAAVDEAQFLALQRLIREYNTGEYEHRVQFVAEWDDLWYVRADKGLVSDWSDLTCREPLHV
eukprot:TRINITY_DN16231_c0_g1_i1.p1 TRINITY_DN16231_c0_g1~~TRINITY_DN16231_c0_g1_i1.p1  ORF type:complete len:262 (+),score=34.96 TRINITY_DN16231_c0_g1_i1:109-894(+)